jgi:hypothetical protein
MATKDAVRKSVRITDSRDARMVELRQQSLLIGEAIPSVTSTHHEGS